MSQAQQTTPQASPITMDNKRKAVDLSTSNTGTSRCNKKKAAPKKKNAAPKKKKSAPKKKKAKETIKAVSRTATSRTWLGGVVVDAEYMDAEYMDTTASDVKKAIQRLIRDFNDNPVSVNIDVERYKQTKFFAIRINWEDVTFGPFGVDFYFDEDQHNQSDYIKDLFIDDGRDHPSVIRFFTIEVVDPYLCFGKESVPVKAAEEELERVLRDVYADSDEDSG
jgi:hypothetical protein